MTEASRVIYKARFAVSAEDIAAAQVLRHSSFVEGSGARLRPNGLDQDTFDAHCRHVLIEDTRTGALVCCFRILPINSGAEIDRSYAAQFYELSAFQDFPGKMVELGRFCVAAGHTDPDILRVAWAALTQIVEDESVDLLFGCSSFHGVETEAYLDAFAMLKERHLAPKRWLPKVKAPDVFRFARRLRRKPDVKRAIRTMPPLLRSYLAMGGWVSDHAVVDRDLCTLHVFTGLEISAIPPARARVLRGALG